MDDEAFTAGGTKMATFRFVIERDEAKSPLAFHVNRLHRAAAVRTRPRSCVPSGHPLVLIAHEHQTHPPSSSSSCQKFKNCNLFLLPRYKEVAAAMFIKMTSVEFIIFVSALKKLQSRNLVSRNIA